MYCRKNIGPTMVPWGTPFLLWFSVQNHLKPPITEKRRNKAKYLTIKLKFVKKASMLNSVKSIGYIYYYSSSSPRPVKSPSNSIRHNCQKICCWSRRPKTIRKSEERPHFSRWTTILLFTNFSKTLLTTERRLTEW